MDALLAAGVSAGGYREILSLHVTSTENGAVGWPSSGTLRATACPGSPWSPLMPTARGK